MGGRRKKRNEGNRCKHMPHLTSAGTPAPSGERHVDDKGGRLGRRSQLEFEPLRRGLRNRSLPLVCTRSYDVAEGIRALEIMTSTFPILTGITQTSGLRHLP